MGARVRRGRRRARALRLRGGAVCLACVLASFWLVRSLSPGGVLSGVDAVALFRAIVPGYGLRRPHARVRSEWDERASPDYYRVVGLALVDVELADGEVSYAELDDLGRSGQAAARVSWDMVREGTSRPRGDMQALSPSGWGHNEKVDIPLARGKAYHGYFWNRSHLVAKSLGGAEVVQNMVCGTRMQNVGSNDETGGMAFCETLVRDWLEAHQERSVTYVVTPLYEGEELVPRSVIVDLMSSDGSLDLEVEVYNAARGYLIDYATGEFERVGE